MNKAKINTKTEIKRDRMSAILSDFFVEHEELLGLLLVDKSTTKNIIWATNNYFNYGKSFEQTKPIKLEQITGKYQNIIVPRVLKTKETQLKRSKEMAEVFTPSWVCNKQNNLIDDAWFGYSNVFNKEKDKQWIPTKQIIFKNNKKWTDYVKDIRLEITCGEAPYLVSRYDTITGKFIELNKRIGLFDRKLRVINENAKDDEQWIKYSIIALQSIYGYEFQGDNLLLARQNILFSYLDYYYARFNKIPNMELIKQVVDIITWNIWQMDGLKFVTPFSCKNIVEENETLIDGYVEKKVIQCPGCKNNDIRRHNGKKCILMDWEKNKTVKFYDLMDWNSYGK